MKNVLTQSSSVLAVASIMMLPNDASSWQMQDGPLATRWAKDVSPANAHPEYPRPQFVRKEWLNLNGLWDLAKAPKDMAKPDTFQTKILVPFPVESALSGVMKGVTEKDCLWYRRAFEVQ